MSTAGSLKFICVTLAIRKTLEELKLGLTYYNLNFSEKPYRKRFIKSRRLAVKMCHSTAPAALLIIAQRHEGATRQTLNFSSVIVVGSRWNLSLYWQRGAGATPGPAADCISTWEQRSNSLC